MNHQFLSNLSCVISQIDTHCIAIFAEWTKLLLRIDDERISWYYSFLVIVHYRNESIGCWLYVLEKKLTVVSVKTPTVYAIFRDKLPGPIRIPKCRQKIELSGKLALELYEQIFSHSINIPGKSLCSGI